MRLIDADALKKRSLDVQTTSYKTKSTYTIIHTRAAKGVTVEDIDNAPTIEAEPVRHGEWLATSWRTKCSLCGFAGSIYDQPVNPFKYCPHCGAKMDGGVENG